MRKAGWHIKRRPEMKIYDALYQLIKAEGVTEDNPYAIPGSPDYSSTYTQDFSFDAIGNMTYKKSTETITPAIQKKGGDDLNYEFTYEYDTDYAHRLKRAGGEKKGWRYYTYDANGNVTSESDGVAPNEDTMTLTPVTVTTQTNEEGSPVYEADYAWAWPWGGNAGGNKPTPNNKRTYEWNSRNLLMRSVNSVYDTRYVYAADGNRAAKWTATQSSETLYFNTMWTWHTDKGLPEGQYSKHIYLGETRVVTKQTSKLEASYGQSDEWHHQYYYHPDHLGSAQLVTDYEGNEYQRIEYTSYGELWVEKKTEKEEGLRYLPYKFTAKEQDEETGLYYYGARYLDAKYSRWMSTDPAVSEYIPMAPVNDEARKHNEKLPGQGGIFNTIAFNLFNYANNNPVKYSDPTGEVPVKPWAVLGTNTHKEIQRYLKSTYKGSSPFYLPSPNPGKKGCFFVDYQRVNTDKKREFYEIKPISYMSNKKGDKQLDKYIARYGEGAVKGMEILDDLNGVEISTNIMSSNPMDFSGKITLYTDKANHPGMIFYSLDDGKTKEEKQKDIVKKGLSLLVGIGLFLLGTGVQPRMPVNPVPAP